MMFGSFASLPVELVIEILAHVPGRDLLQAAQVCRDWNMLLPADPSPTDETNVRNIYRNIDPNLAIDETTGRFQVELFELWTTCPLGPMGPLGPLTVWKRRVEIYYPTWQTLLPPSCTFRWLCLAHSHPANAADMKTTNFTGMKFSGLGHSQTISHRVNCDVISKYVGEFLNGEFHGFGILQATNSPDFQFYTGTWKYGQQHGIGKVLWSTDENLKEEKGERFYIGHFKRGLRHGFGKYQWDVNKHYVGNHRNDLLHGRGTFRCQEGIIDGEWKRNRKHGRCTITWPNNFPKFVGNYNRGRRDGEGTYYWEDGAVFSGQWQGLRREGPGVMKFANGLVFQGNYHDDLRHGQGQLTWLETGDTFEGNWYRGVRKGRGIFTNGQTGERIAQLWDEDENVQYAHGAGAARFPT